MSPAELLLEFSLSKQMKKTTASKSGSLYHDIQYWIGKDNSQDECGVAAIKTLELDASLGGRAVKYWEMQGHETKRFLSYFKPCIIPQEGVIVSGLNHPEEEEYKIHMYVCKGKHVVNVKESFQCQNWKVCLMEKVVNVTLVRKKNA